MADKKIFFSNDSFVRDAEKVTLVDDIKKADIVIDEKDIVDKSFKSDKKYKVVSNSRLADKKVYIKKSKNTSSKAQSRILCKRRNAVKIGKNILWRQRKFPMLPYLQYSTDPVGKSRAAKPFILTLDLSGRTCYSGIRSA